MEQFLWSLAVGLLLTYRQSSSMGQVNGLLHKMFERKHNSAHINTRSTHEHKMYIKNSKYTHKREAHTKGNHWLWRCVHIVWHSLSKCCQPKWSIHLFVASVQVMTLKRVSVLPRKLGSHMYFPGKGGNNTSETHQDISHVS
jgi:hypothetical protein